jgi:hypothetical protein
MSWDLLIEIWVFGCSAMAAPGMRDLSIKHPLPEHDRNENSPVARYLPLAIRTRFAHRRTSTRRTVSPCSGVGPDPDKVATTSGQN